VAISVAVTSIALALSCAAIWLADGIEGWSFVILGLVVVLASLAQVLRTAAFENSQKASM
jgi:hypothetical protein